MNAADIRDLADYVLVNGARWHLYHCAMRVLDELDSGHPRIERPKSDSWLSDWAKAQKLEWIQSEIDRLLEDCRGCFLEWCSHCMVSDVLEDLERQRDDVMGEEYDVLDDGWDDVIPF